MRGLVVMLFLAALAGAVPAAEFSSLEEKMSAQEFEAAGLEKLSPAELAALNGWLQQRLAAGLSGAATRSPDQGFRAFGFGGDSGNRAEVVSRISGEFNGWGPTSVFTLDNGQQWQVSDNSDFSSPGLTNPKVTIGPMMMGSWMLKVEGYNRGARVTRIR